MDQAEPPPLAYAVSDPAIERWRQIRRIIGWFAVAYGGYTVLTSATYLWPGVMRSSGILWLYYLSTGVRSLLAIPLIVGGVMTLNRRDVGWMVVRIASLTILIALTVGAAAVPLSNASSAPAGAYRIGTLLGHLMTSLVGALTSAPALLFLLTFPLRREPG